MEMNVVEELSDLSPSQELLDYYREKVAQFDNEHKSLMQLLQKYKNEYDNGKLQVEREQMRSELIELRAALSDVNVFFHAERQNAQSLQYQNERLQLDLREAEKKIETLLAISGIVEGDLMFFLRDPKNIHIVQQRLPPQLKQLQAKLRESSHHQKITKLEENYIKKIKSLEEQLSKAEKTWLSEKNALLQDRTLCSDEYKVQVAKDAAHITLLNARIDEVKVYLYEANQVVINTSEKHHKEEKKWLAEKDRLLTQITKLQNNINFTDKLEKIQRSGSYVNIDKLTENKSTCELKDLRRENSKLKRQIKEAEDLQSLYESQNRKLEQEMCKLRAKVEAEEELLRERKTKHSNQIKMLQNQMEKLNNRNRKEATGFHSEIKILKTNLKLVIQQVYKIIQAYSHNVEVNSKHISVDDSRAVAELSRAVQLSISDMKRHIMKLEAQLITNPKNPDEWVS